jgi:hypothetical protein
MFLRGSSVPKNSTTGSPGSSIRRGHEERPANRPRSGRMAPPAGAAGRGRCVRVHEHMVGFQQGAGRQGRVVPPDLAARPFGVVEKIKVVHHDDHLCGRSRGNRQRMSRLNHVECPAGQGFDRRPVQAMPRQIEQSHGDPPVDRQRAGNHFRRQPVFPGRRKQRQGLARGPGADPSRPWPVRGRLADTGSLPERRPVVDQDLHVITPGAPPRGPRRAHWRGRRRSPRRSRGSRRVARSRVREARPTHRSRGITRICALAKLLCVNRLTAFRDK